MRAHAHAGLRAAALPPPPPFISLWTVASGWTGAREWELRTRRRRMETAPGGERRRPDDLGRQGARVYTGLPWPPPQDEDLINLMS